MSKVVSVETMRQSDAYTIENLISSKELMYNAGRGIYECVDKYGLDEWNGTTCDPANCDKIIGLSGCGSCRRWYLTCPSSCEKRASGWKAPVAVLAGKGNNAGDGYVVASLLNDNNIPVEIILVEDKFSDDGRYYFDECVDAGIEVKTYEPGMDLGKYGTLVDCLLGTGFSGDIKEPIASLIKEANRVHELGAFVVSADINSGLNGDTGEGELFIKSDLTISIGEFKYGHFIGQATDAMKDKVNVDIGIEIVGEVEEI